MTDHVTDPDAAAVADFAHEMGVLKRLRRAGWWQVGVRDPESVAEHSLRVAQLAALIAAEEGADPARAAYLGLWHDSQETRITDIPHSARPYLGKADNEAVTRDQVRHMPDAAAKTISEAVVEFEAKETLEAQCAKDADKLECLLQALEYRAAGHQHVQKWIDSSRSGITTGFAARIADAALAGSTMNWHEQG
ncbi:HD domain-containing protein [Myceligenerans xiligouense]|uniref:5'-deoxynucleotidase n=1 Tax=Myceligenerans xiligouense TaxID=253184 RepID=A0A3N4Z4D8_9MICO|nr:HD domain-containing protein [Myceligenerans xiligouense]RPF20788.1 putative hydrolase of HD superfamily [Myceligenerans xiligouense]